MSNYLVGLYEWNAGTENYTHSVDGILHLSDDGAFNIKEDRPGCVTCVRMEGDFSAKDTFVINNVKNINNRYDVEIILNRSKFGIRFDRSSSAAYVAFMKDYRKIKERTSNATRYYPSGNIWMCGDVLNGEFTGHCIEYYDNTYNSIKYIGDMEEGEYDGSGDFFSECGLIRVCANNICNGVPNGAGKLYVCGKLIQTFKYNDFKLNTSLTDYCNKVLQHLRTDHVAIYRDGKFNAVSADEKVNYLFAIIAEMSDELEKTKSRLDQVEKITKKSWKLF